MWACGLFVSKCFDSACLSLSLCLSQYLVSLRAVLSPPHTHCSFATTWELLMIFAAFLASEDFLIFLQERRKTITLTKDEWTAITCGEFMVIFCTSSASHPQIRRLGSHLICYRWCRGNIQFSTNATCGCRLPSRSQTEPHYHKKLILSSVRLLCFVLILLLSAHWCTALVLHYWEQLSIKQWIGFWSLNSTGLSSNRALCV